MSLGKKIKTLKSKCPSCKANLHLVLLDIGDENIEAMKVKICPSCNIEIEEDYSYEKITRKQKERRNNKRIRRRGKDEWD